MLTSVSQSLCACTKSSSSSVFKRTTSCVVAVVLLIVIICQQLVIASNYAHSSGGLQSAILSTSQSGALPSGGARALLRGLLFQESRDVSTAGGTRRILNSPPVCRKQPEGQQLPPGLPKLVFVAGIEGSGHHFMEEVLLKLLGSNKTVTQFAPAVWIGHDPFQAMNKKSTAEQPCALCPKLPYPRLLPEFGEILAAKMQEVAPKRGDNSSWVYVRARDSYPMGRVRTPLARPDLLHLADLHGEMFELKIIFMMRNVSHATQSVIRRGFHENDTVLHMRLMEDMMMHFDVMLRQMPCGSTFMLNYNNLEETAEAISGPLSEFLDMGVGPNDVQGALQAGLQGRKKHDGSLEDLKPFDDFYNRRSELLWPFLKECSRSPYFAPRDPSDWPVSLEDSTI